MARFGIVVSLILVLGYFTSAHSQAAGDPMALDIAASSMKALTGGAAISDAALAGTVTTYAGSDVDSGTGVFLGRGISDSRIELDLKSGKRVNVRSVSGILPVGSWSTDTGQSKPYASQNCWTDANWFFPAFTSLSAVDKSIQLKYVGSESRNGKSVYHLRAYRIVDSSLIEASRVDYYLDTGTLLPTSMTFNDHPDNASNVNIGIDVRFSNYGLVNGLQVPLHIQKFLNGGLVLDVNITSVEVNTGLPGASFTLQ